jgi:F1F0 ATPase subunit 2
VTSEADPALLTGAFLTGMLLAAAYLWHLWRSVAALPAARHPMQRVVRDLAIRWALAGAVLYGLLRAGGWPAAVAATAGFTVARLAIVARVAPDRMPPGRDHRGGTEAGLGGSAPGSREPRP